MFGVFNFCLWTSGVADLHSLFLHADCVFEIFLTADPDCEQARNIPSRRDLLFAEHLSGP